VGGWVVFDYGGVLCTDQPEADRRALVAVAGLDPDSRGEAEAFWTAYWRDRPPYDRAELDPAAYWSGVLGRPVGHAEVAAIDAADVSSWSHPQPATLAVVDALARDGVGLALLSNAPVSLADEVDRLDWTRRIPHRFYSCRLRATKPDPAAYGQVLAALGADAGTVTFVDDRPDNVAAAAAVGIRALRFTDPAALAAALGVESPA
jgi:putative hydrolase of the HAD superfamily